MRKFYRVLALLAAMLNLDYVSFSLSWAGETADRISSSGNLVVASDPAWPPFSFIDQSGEWSGFDADVARELARRIGAAAKFVSPPWDEQLAGHWDGKWDICVCSMTPTAERARNLEFPVVYYWSPVNLAVSVANTSVSRPSDLSGKRIGILVPSTYELYLKRGPLAGTGIEANDRMIENPEIISYETDSQAFDALTKNGTIDATMNYLPVLMDEIKRGRPLRIIGTPLFFVSNGIAIDKGDSKLSTLIHDTVEGMRADGTLGQFSTKWFDFDLSRNP